MFIAADGNLPRSYCEALAPQERHVYSPRPNLLRAEGAEGGWRIAMDMSLVWR
jgi:hypothetical protein